MNTYFAKMKHYVHKFSIQYFKCREAKSRSRLNRLYTLLNVTNKPWTNIPMDFVLGRTLKG